MPTLCDDSEGYDDISHDLVKCIGCGLILERNKQEGLRHFPAGTVLATTQINASELNALFSLKQLATLQINTLTGKRKKYVGRPMWHEIQRVIEATTTYKCKILTAISRATTGTPAGMLLPEFPKPPDGV